MENEIKPVPEWVLETYGAAALELGLWAEPAAEAPVPPIEASPSSPEPPALPPWAME